MKDLGDASYALGIRIYRDRSRKLLGLSQSTYIDKVLARFSMSESKRGSLPMVQGTSLSKTRGVSTPEEVERMRNVPYALAIGSIMYAMVCTRPDVAFALSVTSRYQSNPGESHWTAVKNILKYFRRTKDAFLVYGGKEELSIIGYTDVSFQADRHDFKSQAGFFLAHLIKAGLWFKQNKTTGKEIIGLVLSDSKTTGETISNNEEADAQLDVKRTVGKDLVALSEAKKPCLIAQSIGANPICVPATSSSIQDMAAKLPPTSFQKEETTSAESLYAKDLPSSFDLNKKNRCHEQQNLDLKNLTGIKERTPDSKASDLFSSAKGAVRASRTSESDQCITNVAKDKGFEHQTGITETSTIHPRTIPSCGSLVTNDPADNSGLGSVHNLVQCSTGAHRSACDKQPKSRALRLPIQSKPPGALNVQALPFRPAFQGLYQPKPMDQSNHDGSNSQKGNRDGNGNGIQVKQGKSLKELKALSMPKEEDTVKDTPLSILDLKLAYECSKPISLIDFPLVVNGREESHCTEEGKIEDSDVQPEDDIDNDLAFVDEDAVFMEGTECKTRIRAMLLFGSRCLPRDSLELHYYLVKLAGA
ncbi:unnamed protein product [Cuscuta campestris]|uniref:Reverse transcriptase Ty1/copia-type domain-containing protein n=1 Tax=Cuscuta campestris TaxID=132261 RepID=A0A484M5G2_9ASTE|nr:unnamed protein product [Cuscuta campestris]